MKSELTPVEKHGDLFFKRDDYYEYAGVHGGKVRTAKVLCEGAKGLTTAGSKHSPQIVIISHIAELINVPFHGHTASGELSKELKDLERMKNTLIVQHHPGYNTVIKKRALDDANSLGWRYIPFGMECWTAIEQTSHQVENIPNEVKRIVVPVGSAMSLCGIIEGLSKYNKKIPVLGVWVGADPKKTLARWLSIFFVQLLPLKLVKAEESYHDRLDVIVEGVKLDPVYEAKCAKYLEPGDLLWIVGIRNE